MNHTIVNAMVSGLQVGVLCVAAGATLGCVSADPASGSNELEQAAPAVTGSQEMVDCLLPGQIRQLDGTVTYLTQRQLVRMTRENCRTRGGEEHSSVPDHTQK